MMRHWKLHKENDQMNCSITTQWRNYTVVQHGELETSNIKNVYDKKIQKF